MTDAPGLVLESPELATWAGLVAERVSCEELRAPAAVPAVWSRPDYALRPLRPASLSGSGVAVDPALVPTLLCEIFWVYLHVCARRLDTGRLGTEETALLALALRELDPASLRETTELSPSLAALVHAGPAGSVAGLTSRSRVRSLFYRLAAEPERARREGALEQLVASFLHRPTGLFCVEPAPADPRAEPRFFLSAVVPLALARACRSLGLPLEPPPLRVPRQRPAAGAWNAEALVELIRGWREPPELPAPLRPQPPDLALIEAQEALAETLRERLLIRDGFLLALPLCDPARPFVVSLRHDVDRPLLPEQLDAILAFERERGLRSSWYFRPATYRPELASRLLDAGCEVGYHASEVETGDAGFAQTLRSAHASDCVGCTFHGGAGSSYWKGRSSLEAAATWGFEYAEMPSECVAHPWLYHSRRGSLALTPLSVKVEAEPSWVARHLDIIRRARGHAILENHPDLFSQDLASLVDGLLAEGAVVRTVRDHVERCRELLAVQVVRSRGQERREFCVHAPRRCQLELLVPPDTRVEAVGLGPAEQASADLTRHRLEHPGGAVSVRLGDAR